MGLRQRLGTCTALMLLGAGAAGSGTAQTGGHGLAVPAERPLHERLALADAVAIARVTALEPGRLRMGEAVALVGAVPARFEVKRAASRPPALGVGDRAILMLRGARSPYVFAERPDEITALRDTEVERIFREALPALHDALDTPERVEDLYVRWLSGKAPALRLAAATGLGDPDAPFSIGPEAAAALAAASLDPAASAELRSTAAVSALRSSAGATALLSAIPSASHVDPQVLLIALRGARGAGPSTSRALVLRALGDENAGIRRSAARTAASLHDDAVRHALRRLADSDPDPNVRSAALRALGPG